MIKLKRRLARVYLTYITLISYLLKKFLFKNTVSFNHICIYCGHGAGDYLMATSAIDAIYKKYHSSRISIVFFRSESMELAEINNLHLGKELFLLNDNRYKPSDIDLFIVLSGSDENALKFINTYKPKNILGFIFNFNIFSSIKSIEDDKRSFLFENHILRNDFIVKKIFADPSGEIIFNLDNLKKQKRTLGNFLPISKSLKSLDESVIRNLIEKQIQLPLYTKVQLFVFKDEYHKYENFYTELSVGFDTSCFELCIFNNWSELINLLQGCLKIICLDSVAFHLSNGIGLNNIGIFGPTDAKNYIPKEYSGSYINLNTGPVHCYYGTGYKKCICNKTPKSLRCKYMDKLDIKDIIALID